MGQGDQSLRATANALVKKHRLLIKGPGGTKRTELTRSPKRQPRKKGYFDTQTPKGKRCESRPDSASLKDVTPGVLTARRNIQTKLKRAAGRSGDNAFKAKVSEIEGSNSSEHRPPTRGSSTPAPIALVKGWYA